MKTERYKCIAQTDSKGMHFTIGKEYEFDFNSTFCKTHDDTRLVCSFTNTEFYQKFQKVEPNNNNNEMKYKVTVTSTDLTGHEDEITLLNEHEKTVFSIIKNNVGKKILIEPMPEKKKVTVWFYAFDFLSYKGSSVFANLDKDYVLHNRNEMITRGCKVSEILSMEVEI